MINIVSNYNLVFPFSYIETGLSNVCVHIALNRLILIKAPLSNRNYKVMLPVWGHRYLRKDKLWNDLVKGVTF